MFTYILNVITEEKSLSCNKIKSHVPVQVHDTIFLAEKRYSVRFISHAANFNKDFQEGLNVTPCFVAEYPILHLMPL